MNRDIAQGTWNEIKGEIRTKWGKFTDNDLEEFNRHMDRISGKIQKTYGYAKDRADQEYQEFRNALKSEKNQSFNKVVEQVNELF